MAFIDIFNFKKYFSKSSDSQVARYGHVNALYDALSQGSLPYKVYTALLTQSGTDDPVATVLHNTLGSDVIFKRNSIGTYYVINSAGAWDMTKTLFLATSSTGSIISFGGTQIPEYIPVVGGGTALITFDNNTDAAPTPPRILPFNDSLLLKTAIEIRVYN
jgi:hypothetical protein